MNLDTNKSWEERWLSELHLLFLKFLYRFNSKTNWRNFQMFLLMMKDKILILPESYKGFNTIKHPCTSFVFFLFLSWFSSDSIQEAWNNIFEHGSFYWNTTIWPKPTLCELATCLKSLSWWEEVKLIIWIYFNTLPHMWIDSLLTSEPNTWNINQIG